jgi:hypothetical protein
MERFRQNLDFELIYFENNQRAARANHLKRMVLMHSTLTFNLQTN